MFLYQTHAFNSIDNNQKLNAIEMEYYNRTIKKGSNGQERPIYTLGKPFGKEAVVHYNEVVLTDKKDPRLLILLKKLVT